jgi:hypothetical protein
MKKNKRKKVAIIGGGTTRKDVPYDDDGWEFWGVNEIKQKRVDRWFELHPLALNNDYEMAQLKKYKVPVYMIRVYKEVPKSVRYPIEDVLSMDGAREYFTCTFAFQVALAIFEGFKEIGLWGVSLGLGSPRERVVEKACLEWWLGYAVGRGIKVRIHDEDDLAKSTFLYGYNYFWEAHDVNKRITRLGLQIALRNDAMTEIMSNVEYDNYVEFF